MLYTCSPLGLRVATITHGLSIHPLTLIQYSRRVAQLRVGLGRYGQWRWLPSMVCYNQGIINLSRHINVVTPIDEVYAAIGVNEHLARLYCNSRTVPYRPTS